MAPSEWTKIDMIINFCHETSISDMFITSTLAPTTVQLYSNFAEINFHLMKKLLNALIGK